MKLSVEVGLGPIHIVLDGDPTRPFQKGHSTPIFCPCLLWQMAGWIKMSLGTEVDLDPGDIVRWGHRSLPPQKKDGTAPPILTHVLCPNSCIDQDASWCGGRPRPRPRCVTWGPSSPLPKKGHSSPNFRPMSIVAKRLDGPRCHLVRR